MSGISYQIPEEELGVRGLFCPVAVVWRPWEQPLECAKEPLPVSSLVRSQGAQLVLETAVR